MASPECLPDEEAGVDSNSGPVASLPRGRSLFAREERALQRCYNPIYYPSPCSGETLPCIGPVCEYHSKVREAVASSECLPDEEAGMCSSPSPVAPLYRGGNLLAKARECRDHRNLRSAEICPTPLCSGSIRSDHCTEILSINTSEEIVCWLGFSCHKAPGTRSLQTCEPAILSGAWSYHISSVCVALMGCSSQISESEAWINSAPGTLAWLRPPTK